MLYSPGGMTYDIRVPDDREREKNGYEVLKGEKKAMFEYRVEIYAVRKAEEEMNRMAMDGWRVIAVSPNQAAGFGIIVTYERQR